MQFAKEDYEGHWIQKDVCTMAAREMHKKTTKKCHCTPIRMTTIRIMIR